MTTRRIVRTYIVYMNQYSGKGVLDIIIVCYENMIIVNDEYSSWALATCLKT